VHAASWSPLVFLSHMLDVTLFGLAPAGHHLTSILLHALNTWLLFELLRRLTGETLVCALAAALFAWHPLRVESVAWISERKDVLSMAFALGTFHAWLSFLRGRSAWHYAASLICLGLALLVKPMVVTVPCLMLLLDHWPLSRLRTFSEVGPRIAEKLPHFALVGLACAATLNLQKNAMSMGDALTLTERASNAVLAYGGYLGAALWPSGLIVHYAHPYIATTGGIPSPGWQVLLCIVLLFSVSVWVVLRRAPGYARVGWLWFIGTLVPMIGFVQVGTQARADRYTYLAMVGLGIWVSFGGRDLLRRLASRRPAANWQRLAPVLAVSSCLALCLATFLQVGVWRDSISLFEHAYAVEPRNSLVNINLGKAYDEAGRLEAARSHLEVALAVSPDSPTAHYNYANVLLKQGSLGEAERHYRITLEQSRIHTKALGNLAGVLQLQGQDQAAIETYTKVLEQQPRDSVALLSLASLLQARGQHDEALALYHRRLEQAPDDAVTWSRLADALRAKGYVEPAIDAYRRAIVLAPDRPDPLAGLGHVLGASGDLSAAREQYEHALALNPGYAPAREGLALVERMLGERATRAATVEGNSSLAAVRK